MIYQYNQELKKNSRALRKTRTNAEKLLWYKLRARQCLGYKFRRQFPIQNYILDFYCPEKKLAIELDGGQHNDSRQKNYDRERTSVLKKHKMILLRFWDNDVLKNINGILEEILKYLQ